MIFGWSHGRHQPLHHTCEMGDNYAQGHSVSLPHLGRASTVLKSSSKQANLLFVGCVGFLFVFSSGTGEWNSSGRKMQTDLGFILLNFFLKKKKTKKKPND